jgi:hypothetical protein
MREETPESVSEASISIETPTTLAENPPDQGQELATETTMSNSKQQNASIDTTTAAEAVIIYKVPTHDYWAMGMIAFWMAITSILCFGESLSSETRQLIVGSIVNLNLVFFYGAPLSTIATILKTRNTASLHVWTMLTNTANGVFWMAYGFAVLDYFVYVPNGLGALLGFIQMFLFLIFPRGTVTTTTTSTTDETTTDEKKKEKTTAVSKVDEEIGCDMGGFASGVTALTVADNSHNTLSAPFASTPDNQS